MTELMTPQEKRIVREMQEGVARFVRFMREGTPDWMFDQRKLAIDDRRYIVRILDEAMHEASDPFPSVPTNNEQAMNDLRAGVESFIRYSRGVFDLWSGELRVMTIDGEPWMIRIAGGTTQEARDWMQTQMVNTAQESLVALMRAAMDYRNAMENGTPEACAKTYDALVALLPKKRTRS